MSQQPLHACRNCAGRSVTQWYPAAYLADGSLGWVECRDLLVLIVPERAAQLHPLLLEVVPGLHEVPTQLRGQGRHQRPQLTSASPEALSHTPHPTHHATCSVLLKLHLAFLTTCIAIANAIPCAHTAHTTTEQDMHNVARTTTSTLLGCWRLSLSLTKLHALLGICP
jgi:hypothetical protein